MSDLSVARATTAPVPVVSARELLPYVVFAGVLLLTLVYAVGGEQGVMHEWVHDARHLLGFPCH